MINALKCSLLSFLLLSPLAALALGPPDATNGLISSWSFVDSTNWTSDFGYAPISYTNISSDLYGEINCLVVDSTNAALLNYRITESDSNVNLKIDYGSLEFWFRPSWLGTNQPGGTGPGAWGRLLDVGTTTGGATYGLWSLCFDPSGNLWFCAQTNNGTQATFLTTPVAWSTNNDGWMYLSLTYSPS